MDCSSLEVHMLCTQLRVTSLSQLVNCKLKFKLLCSSFDCVLEEEKRPNGLPEVSKEEELKVHGNDVQEQTEKIDSRVSLVRLSLQLIAKSIQNQVVHQKALNESEAQLFILLMPKLSACISRYGTFHDFQLLIELIFQNQSIIPVKVRNRNPSER